MFYCITKVKKLSVCKYLLNLFISYFYNFSKIKDAEICKRLFYRTHPLFFIVPV